MSNTFYVTTPLYYMSDKPQIGNAYPTVAADVMARYKKLRGFDVRFLTGTDDHGLKIERAAAKAGKDPKAYVDGLAEVTKRLWRDMNCQYDIFMRTTSEAHETAVKRVFKKLYDQGDIYKGRYTGLYCVDCETFFTKTQAPDGLCGDCGRPLEEIGEDAYFFKMSKYQDRLLKHIADNPDFIRPESRKNEMLSFIKGGLEDVAVTRTTFTWGIPVDFAPGHVIYVWFEALMNYATALGLMGDGGHPDYDRFWPADVHIVGKDILRFHTVLWPTILMALGEPLPKTVYGTGWILMDGGKMSKSKGNAVDLDELIPKFGVDAIRYYLMREIVMGQDGNYTEEALAARINADLANDLGNLLSRTVGMIERYFGGTLPENQAATAFDGVLMETAATTVTKYAGAMDKLAVSDALSEVWTLVRRGNKYVDETEPWTLHKKGETEALAGVLYNLAETLRITAVLISPVMPGTAAEILRQIGISGPELSAWDSLAFGKLPKAVTVAKGGVIFPRLDLKAMFNKGEGGKTAQEAPKTQEKSGKPEITIDDFAKAELKVGVILQCEKVSDKLLKSQVRIGGETRQILSGVAEFYAPEDMVGKHVVVVTNLRPIKLRGHLSEGMILAASGEAGVKLVTADGAVDGDTVS